jgi:type I restriction enzyme S subunit
VKAGWSTRTLGEACEIKPPKAEARKRLANTDMVSFVPMEDLGIDQKLLKPTQTKPLSEVTGSYTYFADGDVLLAKITPCFENGKLGIATDLTNGIGFGSSEYIVFRPSKTLNKEWLYYFLLREDFRIEGSQRMSGAVGHKRVVKEFIEGYPIPLPPLPDQQRIVGILDEAFDGIATAKANTEKNLQNARQLFQSILSAAVIGDLTKNWRANQNSEERSAGSDFHGLLKRIKGIERKTFRKNEETVGHESIIKAIPKDWELASVESLFNIIDYRGKNPPKSKDGKRLITAKNIKMGYISDEPATFISEETYKKWMVRGHPKPGDILFVTEGHTMGFAALNTRADDFALAQRTITLQPIVPINTKYFFYYIISKHFQDLVRINATGAAAVGMKGSKFRSLPIPFPSFAEQQIIVNNLDSLRKETQRIESIYQKKLSALNEFKKSLLHQAFTGQL